MKSIIIGAGTYGEVYAAYLQEAQVDIVGFLDDNETLQNQYVFNLPILGNINCLESLKTQYGVEAVYCPIGNNILRIKLLEMANEMGYLTPNFIHSTVYISPNVKIGNKGIYIFPNTSIMPFTKIQDYSMISLGVNIAHHTILEEGVFISTGCNIGANLLIEKCAYIGISSTIMTGVKKIGKNSLVGASSNVIKDIPENVVVAGNPAKFIKYKEKKI